MQLVKDLEESSLYLLDSGDFGLAKTTLERPQLMRLFPTADNKATLNSWQAEEFESSAKVYLTKPKTGEYVLGMVVLSPVKFDGKQFQSVAFSFDRCIAGRKHALSSLKAVAESVSLDGSVFLVGPSMANSERAAKSFGDKFDREATVNSVPCKVFTLA